MVVASDTDGYDKYDVIVISSGGCGWADRPLVYTVEATGRKADLCVLWKPVKTYVYLQYLRMSRPRMILIASITCPPATMALVVAMAGMMFPAICFT